MTRDQFKQLPRDQRYGVHRKFQQNRDGSRTFADFIARLEPECYGDAVMINWCGMWLGIEPDGYTHS